ncbi:MAG TPA: tetratricopeptide repeat protein [Nitrospiraceae bacterium]|nr:tetratricopeptide repeat protein [Nitrospiraceae bacterium]
MFRLWCEERGVGGENKKTEGNILVEHERYREAENVYLAAIDQAEQIGSLNPRLADSLNELGMLYAKEHKYARAEQMFQRGLGVMVAALGPDHPDVAIILKNMGILKASKKEYAEADLLLKQSLVLTTRALGHEHPMVAVTMRTIAVCQAIQGRYGEAEQLIRRSLEVGKKILGPEHPEVATSAKVLAQVLRAVDRDPEVYAAESQVQEVRTEFAATTGMI